MHFVPFDVDGAEGTRGTQILAGSTAYATTLVDGRDVGRLFVVGVARNHIDGTRRTVARTVAALHTIADSHTVLFDEYGVTNLGGCFQLMCQGLDGASGANLRTSVTLRTAVAALVRHRWHHQVQQVVRRP